MMKIAAELEFSNYDVNRVDASFRRPLCRKIGRASFELWIDRISIPVRSGLLSSGDKQ